MLYLRGGEVTGECVTSYQTEILDDLLRVVRLQQAERQDRQGDRKGIMGR